MIMVSEEGKKASHSSPASEKERAGCHSFADSSERGALPSGTGGRSNSSAEKSPHLCSLLLVFKLQARLIKHQVYGLAAHRESELKALIKV